VDYDGHLALTVYYEYGEIMLIQNVYYAFIGIAAAALGGNEVLMAVQFYFGRRRELYFKTGREWDIRAQDGVGLLLVGIGLFFGFLFNNMGFMLSIPCFFVPIWFWVYHFEKGRAGNELEYIKQRGAELLIRYPKTFPRMAGKPG
jgi:hypothetical protein